MKITYYEPREIELEIEDISLLTTDEAGKLPEEIREYREWWWLKTAGDDTDRAAYVDSGGFVDCHGDDVCCGTYAVRPAVTIRNLESLNFEIGDPLMIQGEEYVYIGNNRALYNDEVTYDKFDEVSNDYEKSLIKQVVDKWLEK